MKARFFRALPAYLGGKRRLAPLIFARLSDFLPVQQWRGLRLLDPMCGGGAICLYAKAFGFEVVASDVAERGAVVARALIGNSSVRLRQEDVLDLFREPVDFHLCKKAVAQFVPAVFAGWQAECLDRAIARAEARPEPLQSLLKLVVIKAALRLQPMSLLRGTDARAAAGGDYDRVSPRRLGHYMKTRSVLTPEGVWGLAQDVNAGVFGGSGAAQKGDARHILQDTRADIVYLDPPYPGTTSYDREYGPLDALLGDEDRTAVTPPTLDELLTAAANVPLVVISYGGPGQDLDKVVATVGKYRPLLSAAAVPYPHLRSIAGEERNAKNKEYIVIAGR
jgi:SAM-dependent methyltransferase